MLDRDLSDSQFYTKVGYTVIYNALINAVINTVLSIAGSLGGENQMCSNTLALFSMYTLRREINLRGGKSLCSHPLNTSLQCLSHPPPTLHSNNTVQRQQVQSLGHANNLILVT